MRLEIPIKEIQEFLSDYYHIDIGLKNIEENKIKATYIDSVVLIIKEVKEDVVFINYEVDGLAVIAAKVAHFFLEKKLDNIPVEWDAKTKEVTIDLKKIPELIELLKFVYISELHFVNDNILFEFYVRDKT
ncbi:MAG: hypothetical protein M0Q51_07085 [Bacteroidales bacterium]|nr:hypothetical protein [Bacteroidales bacterium]